MAKINDQFAPGIPAPEVGTYQCAASGCTQVFNATVKGAPLPPAHHPGLPWKLVTLRGSSTSASSRKPGPAPTTTKQAAPTTPKVSEASQSPHAGGSAASPGAPSPKAP